MPLIMPDNQAYFDNDRFTAQPARPAVPDCPANRSFGLKAYLMGAESTIGYAIEHFIGNIDAVIRLWYRFSYGRVEVEGGM